jgi:4-hydroxyphenylacetate 3-monooxygenase
MSAIRLFAEWNRQMISHFISIGASGLVSVPQEKTLDMFSENIGKYFSGAGGQDSKERVSLFRMAWDLAGSSWGGRNELYERFFTGDSQRAIANTYLRMDKSEAVDIIRRMLLPGENGHPFPLPEKFGGPALPPLVEDTEECLD